MIIESFVDQCHERQLIEGGWRLFGLLVLVGSQNDVMVCDESGRISLYDFMEPPLAASFEQTLLSASCSIRGNTGSSDAGILE